MTSAAARRIIFGVEMSCCIERASDGVGITHRTHTHTCRCLHKLLTQRWFRLFARMSLSLSCNHQFIQRWLLMKNKQPFFYASAFICVCVCRQKSIYFFWDQPNVAQNTRARACTFQYIPFCFVFFEKPAPFYTHTRASHKYIYDSCFFM